MDSPWNVQAENKGELGVTGYDAADEMEVAIQGPTNQITEIAIVLDSSNLSDVSNKAISDSGALLNDVAGAEATRWAQSILEADDQDGSLRPATQSQVFGKDRVTILVDGLTSFAITPAAAPRPEAPPVNLSPSPTTTEATGPNAPPKASTRPSGCSPGDLTQAYVDQQGSPPIAFQESSCDGSYAIAVGLVDGTNDRDIAIFRMGPDGAQLETSTQLSAGQTAAMAFGVSAAEYSQLTGELQF